jgi:hypothetical protein
MEIDVRYIAFYCLTGEFFFFAKVRFQFSYQFLVKLYDKFYFKKNEKTGAITLVDKA